MPGGGQGREGLFGAVAQGLQRRRNRQILRDEAPALKAFMTRFLLSLVISLGLASPAFAQHQLPPGADPSQFKPLPDRNDVLSWKLLSQVELVKQKDRYVPQFAAGVAALDKKEVKVQGFMMPLQMEIGRASCRERGWVG